MLAYIYFGLMALTATVVAEDINCKGNFTTHDVVYYNVCRASYPAGPVGNCSSGYDAEPGNVSTGIFCSRPCTNEEAEDCLSQDCKKYSRACRQGLERACIRAIERCKGPESDHICDLVTARKCLPKEFCRSGKDYVNKCNDNRQGDN